MRPNPRVDEKRNAEGRFLNQMKKISRLEPQNAPKKIRYIALADDSPLSYHIESDIVFALLCELAAATSDEPGRRLGATVAGDLY